MASYSMFDNGMSFGGGSSNALAHIGDIGMNAWAGFQNGMQAHNNYMDWRTKANTHNNALNQANAALLNSEAQNLYQGQLANGMLNALGVMQAFKNADYQNLILQQMGIQGTVNNPQSTLNTQGTSVNSQQTMAHTPAGKLANPAPNTTGFTVQVNQPQAAAISNTEYLQKFGGY